MFTVNHLDLVGKQTWQSSDWNTWTGSENAVDGNSDPVLDNGSSVSSCACTSMESDAWWAVDLGGETIIGSVTITNRLTSCKYVEDY